jgi:hypothetical protein
MNESDEDKFKPIKRRKRIGKIAVVLGSIAIASVIVLGKLTTIVTAYDDSTDLLHLYDTIAVPILIFGILFVVSGLLAILLPEGLTKVGIWSLQTGPLR